MLVQILIAVFVVVFVIWLAGQGARRRLRRQYPPVGNLVNIGGYRLHIHQQGDSGPTVVFDAGIGEAGLSWAAVQTEAAKFARAVVYDRAGLGWSEKSSRPRTAAVMVEELHTLLHQAGIPGPYILVGASFGGLLSRLYARQYPDEVVGMVLVDAAHEEQYCPEPIRAAVDRMSKMMPMMYGLLRLFVWTGIPALWPQVRPLPGYFKLPKPAAETYGALLATGTKMIAAQTDELALVMESHAQVREAQINSLGDMPLVVLRHGLVQKQMTPELTELMEATNIRLQAELATQSSNGRLVIAENSGHAIQFDEPGLVVEAIADVVAAVNKQESVHDTDNMPVVSTSHVRSIKCSG